jgi:hypothetical protein
MQNLTISGKTFQVAPRYAEGHVLTANEASTLNQTFFENIRNNFAQKAKDGGTQAELDAYVEGYNFGVRTGGGGGSRDPIQVEAMNLARDAVKKAIVASGKKIADFTAKAISEAAAKLIEKKPEYMEKAKARVAEMQAIAGNEVDSDILGDLTAAAEAETDTADTAEGADGSAEGQPSEEAATDENASSEEAPAGRRGRKASAE